MFLWESSDSLAHEQIPELRLELLQVPTEHRASDGMRPQVFQLVQRGSYQTRVFIVRFDKLED